MEGHAGAGLEEFPIQSGQNAYVVVAACMSSVLSDKQLLAAQRLSCLLLYIACFNAYKSLAEDCKLLAQQLKPVQWLLRGLSKVKIAYKITGSSLHANRKVCLRQAGLATSRSGEGRL